MNTKSPRNPATFGYRVRSAFTLVEILIVVIILGILAAIVIPQFTNAATDARTANMQTQLKNVRSLIELYRLQHNSDAPLLVTGDGWELMTSRTTEDGTLDTAGMYGPYMQGAPVNPLTNSSTVVAVGATPTDKPGWYYDESTGAFHGANPDGEMSDTGT